ncbi:MAG: ABC transporter permease [Cyclobacteriaceae bacterium]
MEDVAETPPHSLSIPGKIKQSLIFVKRDFLSKISNKQYLMINLLEAPLLAMILAFIIRYRSSPSGTDYVFRFNENIPAFMLMSIIVALFMGLTVSAEEIIRDRKILKRESFLNLSWNSYLVSKVALLFLLSAIQTFTFVIIGNLILEIHDMTLAFWIVLFSASCLANVLGLNISAAFKSAVTVYVLIPLLLIPQMILSGLLFNFDRLNDAITTKGKVPIVADLMASRWAYEAMAVYQFKENGFEYLYFDLEKKEADADFKAAYIQHKLLEKSRQIRELLSGDQSDSVKNEISRSLKLISKELEYEPFREGLDEAWMNDPDPSGLSNEMLDNLDTYLDGYRKHYQELYNSTVSKREEKVYFYETNYPGYNLNSYKDQYFNESLADLVTNATETERVVEFDGQLLRQINPIFHTPDRPANALDYRAHFFAPVKYFAGHYIDTYWFNVAVIWLMTLVMYITLYTEVLRKFVNYVGNISLSRKKNG